MGRIIKATFILIFIALIGIQFINVERTNPPVTAEIKASNEVNTIFRNACYDCHSNETKWPWYSKIAPVSWLIINHVEEGRSHLNFSDWENYKNPKKDVLKEEIWNEINNDKMPLKMYTYLHQKSNLDPLQRKTINEWATRKKPWE